MAPIQNGDHSTAKGGLLPTLVCHQEDTQLALTGTVTGFANIVQIWYKARLKAAAAVPEVVAVLPEETGSQGGKAQGQRLH